MGTFINPLSLRERARVRGTDKTKTLILIFPRQLRPALLYLLRPCSRHPHLLPEGEGTNN